MNDKKKKSNVFAEKGLYIVLFISVAIVGIASWALLFSDIGIFRDREAVNVVNGTVDEVLNNKVPENNEDTNNPDSEQAEPSGNAETPETKTPEADTDAEQKAISVWQDAEMTSKPETEKEEDKSEDAQESAKFIWPLSGEVEVSYSMNELIYDKTMADWRTHDGLDIEAQIGTKVMSVMNGTVEKVYTDDMYGTTVIINHGNDVRSIYSNLASVPTVNEGDTVECGAVIGSVGDTAAAETSEISHLHFAMTADGESVDPMDYLPKN